MKLSILVLVLAFFSATANGQFLEKVYLNDSVTVHEGWIIEQVPQVYLKMLRQQQRDTITIDVADVWKITRVIDTKKLDRVFRNPLVARSGYSQAVYFELLGNGALYSFNYDRRFKKGRRDGWGYRIGFGYFRITDSIPGSAGYRRFTSVAIPVDINYLIGKRKGALELGLSATYIATWDKGSQYTYNDLDGLGLEPFNLRSNGVIGFLNCAYRYRPAGNGLFLKAGLTTIIYPETLPYIGLSIGYHFQKN